MKITYPMKEEDMPDEQLLKAARLDIETQIDNGTMYAIDEEPKPEHCNESGDWTDGENFYTIITLYAQCQADEKRAEELLWKMFRSDYPQYFGNGQD